MKKAKIRKTSILNRTIVLIFAFLLLPVNGIHIYAEDNETVYYSQTDLQDDIPENNYLAFVIDGLILSKDFNGIKLSQAEYNEGKLAVKRSNVFTAEGNKDSFTISAEGRPGTADYIYADSEGLKSSNQKPDGYWKYEVKITNPSDLDTESTDDMTESDNAPESEEETVSVSFLSYHIPGEDDNSETVYYIGVSENAPVVLLQEPVEGNTSIYMGSEKPSMGKPPSEQEKTDELAPVITKQMDPFHYAFEGSGYDAPEASITAKLPDGVTADKIVFSWIVNGSEYKTEEKTVENDETVSDIELSVLENKSYGVYPVYCKVTVTVDEKEHSVNSYTNNFIVTKGIRKNSLLTFSDVHEKWDFIGQALGEIMTETDGLLPALVVATGDYNNSYVAGYNEEFINKCINTMIKRIDLQLSGLDTVWVSGNHDNGYATGFTNANKKADLGMIDSEYYDVASGISGTGIIYNSRTVLCEGKGESSRNIDPGLIVIGINYEDLGSNGAFEGSANGRPSDSSKLSYGTTEQTNSVYMHLKNALDKCAENYNKELIIISTHAGLHAVGIDQDSNTSAWTGGHDYTIDNSDQVVEMINDYADKYDMDIMFLFGHNHSHGESEFFKVPGDSIAATVKAGETSSDIDLLFSYGNSGYITDSINGHKNYSFIVWDEETIYREMRTLENGRNETLSVNIGRIHNNNIEPDNKEETKPVETQDIKPSRYVPPLTGISLNRDYNYS